MPTIKTATKANLYATPPPTTPPTTKPRVSAKKPRQPLCVKCGIAYATHASTYGFCQGCTSRLTNAVSILKGYGVLVVLPKILPGAK